MDVFLHGPGDACLRAFLPFRQGVHSRTMLNSLTPRFTVKVRPDSLKSAYLAGMRNHLARSTAGAGGRQSGLRNAERLFVGSGLAMLKRYSPVGKPLNVKTPSSREASLGNP